MCVLTSLNFTSRVSSGQGLQESESNDWSIGEARMRVEMSDRVLML